MKVSSIVAYTAALIAGASARPATPVAAAPAATETLGWAQHWIRSPTGQYLQAAVPWTAADAVLGSPSTAGEFNIVSTSLVDTVHTPTFLYATVAPQSASATKLKVSFAEGDLAPASAGVFAWSGTGKSLTWSRDGVTSAGWLTCENDVLYVNLATAVPAGCTAVNIASYQGVTAV